MAFPEPEVYRSNSGSVAVYVSFHVALDYCHPSNILDSFELHEVHTIIEGMI
jgi:hypothetical protein